MGHLSIEHPFTVDVIVVDQSCCIFTEVMEDFDDGSVLQDALQSQLKRIHQSQIKDIAKPLEPNL